MTRSAGRQLIELRTTSPDRLYLIDTLGPFFAALPACGTREYNWSKVPFALLDQKKTLSAATANRIAEAFDGYIEKVRAIGFNALSFDDLAHCVSHEFYPADLRERVAAYQALYERLFERAARAGMKVFVNTDILFFNEAIRAHTRNSDARMLRFLAQSLRLLFRRFPHVDGVIMRLGESDGVDVDGSFHSELVIRTVRQCRRLIRSLLPLMERRGKTLVLRSWTLGAFEIGDLMWNVQTYHRVFDGIHSDNLVVAHKFGESDFFRYLNLNPLFFESYPAKIVELQTRREYEGFGEFPAFVGFEYERYARYLSECDNVVGVSVWCQTGGWTHFDRLTFIRGSSTWSEANTFVALRIFRDGWTAEQAASTFLQFKGICGAPESFLLFLRLADQVVRELWYIPEFARKRLYFRRTRVPPLLWVFWDNVIITHSLRKVIRRFVHERKEAVHDGYRMLHKIRRMQELARELGLGDVGLEHQYALFKILAMAREYYLGEWDPDLSRRIQAEVDEYRERYPNGFHITCDFVPVHFKKWMVKTIFALSLRPHPHYRLMDRLFLLRFTSLVYPLVNLWQKRRLPAFARNQAMGIHVLFK
jgi:hypothetical protein